jgi:hypothetical protein
MSSSDDDALKCASELSRALISAGLASCEDGAIHIKASRKALARSLDLLSRTAKSIRDKT